jgi:hypothetical protein
LRGIPGDSGFFVLREPILLVKPFALRNVVGAVDWPNRTRFQPLICARDARRFQVRALLGQCFLFAFIIPKRSGSKIAWRYRYRAIAEPSGADTSKRTRDPNEVFNISGGKRAHRFFSVGRRAPPSGWRDCARRGSNPQPLAPEANALSS